MRQVLVIEGLEAACVSKKRKLTRGTALDPSNKVVLEMLNRVTSAALCALMRSRECLTLTTAKRPETVLLAQQLVRAVGTEALLFNFQCGSRVPADSSDSDVIDLTREHFIQTLPKRHTTPPPEGGSGGSEPEMIDLR